MTKEVLFARLSMLLAFRERVDEVMKDGESPSYQSLARWIDFVVEGELGNIGKIALQELDLILPNSSFENLIKVN